MWPGVIDYLQVVPSGDAFPTPIPAIIQAEDYDRGGPWVGFDGRVLDLEPLPPLVPYRVDNAHITIAGGTQGLWMRAPDNGDYHSVLGWLAYTVETATDGTFDIHLRSASYGGALVRLEVDGVPVSELKDFYYGGGVDEPSQFGFVEFNGIHLTAGPHRLRLITEVVPGSYMSWPGFVDLLKIMPSSGLTPLLTSGDG